MLAKYMDIDSKKFFTENVAKTAHCFGADVFLNLESAISAKVFKKGDYYMMFLIGVSGSFGTAILQYLG
jgi:3-oxoacyl-[acyl-carrier-protein] synthase-3